MIYLKRCYLMLLLFLFWIPITSQAYIPEKSFNTLRVPVRTAYPANVITVGQAVMYVLAATDYKLAVGYPASTTAASIAIRPIPPEAIQEKIMPVYQALLLLIGYDSRLVVDTRHKLITFENVDS